MAMPEQSSTFAKPTSPPVDYSRFTPDGLQTALTRQLEWYLSRENLSMDAFLVSHMNAELFVPIDLFLGFGKVKLMLESVSGDKLAALQDAIKKSDKLVLSGEGGKVRPNFRLERTTLILRNIPSEAPVDRVTDFLATLSLGAEQISSVRADIGDNWYVKMKSEEAAMSAVQVFKGVEWEGRKVGARIKSESLLKQYHHLCNNISWQFLGHRLPLRQPPLLVP